MEALILLVPVSLLLGALGLIGFLWALRSRQYDDLEGAAARILFDDQPGKDPPPGPVPAFSSSLFMACLRCSAFSPPRRRRISA
jgi:cbb3-type cytochrome oxidase maturation protein